MAEKKKAVAIIPARKGSRRLPGKNMLPLGGKPLIQWTIEAAQRSSAITDILVTSDDDAVLALAERLGVVHRIIRPDILATAEAKTSDVVLHALRHCHTHGLVTATLCLLQATSPLRTAADIDTAFSLFRETGAPSVISVCELDHPLAWCVSVDKSRLMRGICGDLQTQKSNQDTGKFFRLNGAIYISNTDAFIAANGFISDKSIAYIMDRDRSIDIDTKFDFTLAQALLYRRSIHSHTG